MGDVNDDFEKENIEITGGSLLKRDDEDTDGTDTAGGDEVDDSKDKDIDEGLAEDDELDAKELDIPYKDEEESL